MCIVQCAMHMFLLIPIPITFHVLSHVHCTITYLLTYLQLHVRVMSCKFMYMPIAYVLYMIMYCIHCGGFDAYPNLTQSVKHFKKYYECYSLSLSP